MKYKENPEVARIYLQRIRDMMSGKSSMPEVNYPARPVGEVHASNVDGLCPLQTYYSWTLSDVPPHTDKTILNFFSGRGFERQIATEQDPIVVDGIHLTIDDDLGDHGITEIKTTRRRMKNFKPDEYSWWTCRAMQYCYARDVTEMNLVVYFIIDSVIKSWKLMFTEEEIGDNWGECLDRRDQLIFAFNDRLPIDCEHVKANLPTWQCKGCQYNSKCYYYNEVINGL